MKKSVLSILVAGILAFGISCQAEATPIITDGLVAAYEFNGNASDSSGNANNSIGYNGVNFTGGAVDFNGEAYIEVADNPSLDLTNQITIATWAQLNDFASYGTILTKGALHTPSNPDLHYENYQLGYNNGRLAFDYVDENGVTLWNDSYHYYITDSSLIGDTEWHHIAMTYIFGQANSLSFYIDGDLISGGNWTFGSGNVAPSETNNYSLFIGNQNERDGQETIGTVYSLNGSLDDTLIYDRALSSSEINSIYTATSLVPEPATMLLFSTGIAGLAGIRFTKRKKMGNTKRK